MGTYEQVWIKAAARVAVGVDVYFEFETIEQAKLFAKRMAVAKARNARENQKAQISLESDWAQLALAPDWSAAGQPPRVWVRRLEETIPTMHEVAP